MITITTSNFFSTMNIDERLKDVSFIRSICDDVHFEKNGTTYLIRNGYYKLEFSFSKENIFIYFMAEMYEKEHSQNKYVSFIDDLGLFNNKNIVNKLISETIKNGCVKINNVEFYLSDNQIESLYLLSPETTK